MYGIIEKTLRKVFNGKLKEHQTDPDLAITTAETLMRAVTEAGGAKERERPTRNHLYAFSAAKSYAQLVEMRDGLFDENGDPVSFGKFRKKALKINEKYNELWLEAEYNAVVRSTVMANQWQEIQADADIFPYLKYVTAGDERVRLSHQKLDGITLPIDDPFWQNYYPPNGWNCRCTVEQLMEADKVSSSSVAINEAEKATPQYWRKNVGTTNIFPEDETAYFNSMPGQELEAVRHYGLKDAGYLLAKGAKETWTDGTNTIQVTMSKGAAEVLITDEKGAQVSTRTLTRAEDVEVFRKGILIER